MYNQGVMKYYDIVIAGGGASGMAAAVAARMENKDASILLLEKNDKLGRKVLATGNGRCNFTNAAIPGVEQVLDFFGRLGMAQVTEEEGRMYPASRQAEDVVYVLENYIRANDILVETKTALLSLAPYDGYDASFYTKEQGDPRLVLTTEKGKIAAHSVLLAVGGKAGPQYGTVGEGYGMARELGLSVSPVYPVLTALEAEGTAGLDGVRADGLVRLYRKDTPVFEEAGQIQFTKYGLSGIVMFNASRFVRLGDGLAFGDYTVSIDFAPGIPPEMLLEAVRERQSLGEGALRTMLPKRLAEWLEAEAPGETVRRAKDLRFTLTGVRGWKNAQATGGGVDPAETDRETMACAKVPGLYLSGEMLDEAGPCGGFNLHQAWITGMKAGKGMAHDL